jgi:hypothetical protein
MAPAKDEAKPDGEKPSAKGRTPTELLCAVAVGAIAFWAPAEDTGFVLRTITAAMALGALLFAMIGLEMLLDYQKKKNEPKANPFEVVVKSIKVPTAPPGGVFAAACKMDELLQGFPVDIKSRVKSTEFGFQILSGSEKLKVTVEAGTAIGWEHGSTQWLAKRDEWIQAVQAAPRCEEVKKIEWMGIAAMEEASEGAGSSEPADGAYEASSVVKIDGLASKPELNGKLGVVTTKGVNDAGRVGVRPEGQKDSLLLKTSMLKPLPAFERLGVSVNALARARAQRSLTRNALARPRPPQRRSANETLRCRSHRPFFVAARTAPTAAAPSPLSGPPPTLLLRPSSSDPPPPTLLLRPSSSDPPPPTLFLSCARALFLSRARRSRACAPSRRRSSRCSLASRYTTPSTPSCGL